MKRLDEDIKAGQFQPVYLLYGAEAYLKQQYKVKLRDALVRRDDTMNFARYEGKHMNPRELIDLAETMPFFAERRLILIEDSGFFKAGCEELAKYLPQMPPSTCMLFVETEVDKRGKMYKAACKIGYAAEFAEQKEELLVRWILGRMKRENKKITQSVLSLFLSKTGPDMGNIDKELEKLLCYTMGREVIAAEDVQAICSGQISNRIFDMVNAIGKRQQRRALTLYYDLLALKEPPMRILFLINRQFRILLDLKTMKRARLDAKAMAEKAGIPLFAVRRNTEQADAFTERELRQAMESGVGLETDIKTGRVSERIGVELFLVQCSAPKSGVEA